MKTFSERLKEARKMRGLTQKEAAARVGINTCQWAHYEQGVNEPRITALSSICDALNVSADYLVGHIPPGNNCKYCGEELHGPCFCRYPSEEINPES